MTRTLSSHLPIGLLVALAVLGQAEGTSRWRIFRAADGLGEAFTVVVTISPRGNVWAKHGNSGLVSRLDGFQIRTFPHPGPGNSPVYESRSSQLWSVYSDGLMEFRGEQWFQYPLPEIRGAVRSARPIPLLPAERDHVLVLMPDRLLEYDAAQNKIITLRWATNSEVGRFIDLVEARDGGAWISGSRGLAKLPGPIRRLTPDAPWQSFAVDPAQRAQGLERPFEDDDGGVTVVGDSLVSTNRVVLHFNGQSWEAPTPAPARVRGAWRDVDRTLWAFSRGDVLTWDRGQWQAVEIPGIQSGQCQFYDVATEPGGVFWVASDKGLIRRAPQIWRAPPGRQEDGSPVFGILEDRRGALFFATAAGLLQFQDGQWREFDWPDGARPRGAASLFELADGRVVIGVAGGAVVFDPRQHSLLAFPHSAGRLIRQVLGQGNSGTLYVSTLDQSSTKQVQFETFDGKNFAAIPATNHWGAETEFFFLDETRDGERWLGTDEGVWKFDEKQQSFVTVTGSPLGPATCFLETGQGKTWCGIGDWIAEYDGRSWRRLRSISGRINAIETARDGSVLVAAATGVHRFAGGSWVVNSRDEGLPDPTVFKLLQDQRAQIWAATGGGLSQYHRSADVDPPTAFLPEALNPKEVSASETVVINFQGRDKWDYTPRGRLLYSYRLDERPWSAYTTDTSVTFTDLLAGQHRFLVRAMDRNGNEQAEPAGYEFVAIVPWFREPRLVVLALSGGVVTLLLAWLAINRHLRLARSHAEVERVVAQRTRELERANQELLHSQKMRALGTLAAGIAHDFNNILSIIKGSAQIIEGHLEDREKIRTRVDRIKTVVEQGSGIVKAMLGFSRVIEGKSAECDVNQLIAETTKLLGDQFLQGIRLRLELAPTLPRVKGVTEVIQQMLLNFIINAVEAMGGQGQIVLRTALLDRLPDNLALAPAAAGQYVCAAVQDSGCGIASAILPRIFEPFFTTKAFSTKRGTGLGLSMVYEMAKELGFGLGVESAEGQGSTFMILMPVSPARPEPQA